ncbi:MULTISPECIES: hypothetical protein [unclassified Microbacterium]|uniref:hypothetical protein n=1 Tax=Microbacterium TaxID=33882 RepID=UPI003BA00FC1
MIASVSSLAVGLGGAWLLFRQKKVEAETEESKLEASATDAFLKGQQAFQTYVDGIVQARVAAAVAELQDELGKVRAEMATMRRESHEMNDAIRARETQLWLWNIRNRPGPMPELPHALLARLGISHLSTYTDLGDTQPTSPKETS